MPTPASDRTAQPRPGAGPKGGGLRCQADVRSGCANSRSTAVPKWNSAGEHQLEERIVNADHHTDIRAVEWPTSALAAAERAFTYLTIPPAPLALDGRVVGHGLPARHIPLDELRDLLVHDPQVA